MDNGGLQADARGTLLRGGKPYRGMGVNYFDVFYRRLKNPGDSRYREGFQVLAEHNIPFARFMAGGFWPSENRLYREDKERYFGLLEEVVRSAEKQGVGLIPSLFWHASTVPDLVGEPLDQWGNPRSKTHAFLRQYTREIVTRFADSPAVWGWEFGNEYNLRADLPNASEHRPQVVPRLGTAASRSKRDELTHAIIRTALKEFSREVRRHDPHRILISGNSLPRPSAWHQQAELSWKQDSEQQYSEMLPADNPDPIDTLCVHLYPTEAKRFGRSVSAEELLRLSLRAARKAKKPLVVGEFGASEEKGPEAARRSFHLLLEAILRTGVPLAALWVYDHASQEGTWNVTSRNGRAYQLKALEEANHRIRSGSPPVIPYIQKGYTGLLR